MPSQEGKMQLPLLRGADTQWRGCVAVGIYTLTIKPHLSHPNQISIGDFWGSFRNFSNALHRFRQSVLFTCKALATKKPKHRNTGKLFANFPQKPPQPVKISDGSDSLIPLSRGENAASPLERGRHAVAGVCGCWYLHSNHQAAPWPPQPNFNWELLGSFGNF